MKGSYYINCAFYQDPSLQSAINNTSEDFPEYTAPNVWPPEDFIPGFRAIFEELCTLVIDTAVLVAQACDRYASAKIEGYEEGYLTSMVKTSTTTKARLLHYYPSDPSNALIMNQKDAVTDHDATQDDNWCATHVDHGCLTGLTSALYIDESAHPPIIPQVSQTSSLPPLPALPAPSSPLTGLYIKSRASKVTKVDIPPSCVAFQTGEALQLITNGKFRAVPHFVRTEGSDQGARIARNTLAVFTQPNLGEIVDRERGLTFAEFSKEVTERFG